MALLNKLDNCRFHIDAFYIDNDDLQYYLLACDVVVLPYAESLTSGAAVLALGYGRPVIAPKLGYLCDLIDDEYGILYNPNTFKELVESLKKFPHRQFEEEIILKYAQSITWDSASNALIR